MTTGYVCVSSRGLPTAPNKSANLNTQNVGQKIVSPLSAGPILKPKSVLCVPTGQFGKRTRLLVGYYIYGRNWLQSTIPNPPHKH